MMSHNLEHRAAPSLTVSNRRLVGVAAPFNTETRIADFRELIRPGAFTKSLQSGRDILCLRDHDTSVLLGRTKTQTLELEERADGLHYSVKLPDTQAGRDLLALAERGDLGGVSFGFQAVNEHWDKDLRELQEVELHEISIVQAWPAYDQTTVSLRSKMIEHNAIRRLWLETICG